jgi:tetratricopeptide (TPR) repeat protein
MSAGRYSAAARRLEKYIEKRPTDEVGYLLLAKCHFHVGDYMSSLEVARNGLTVAPDDQDLLIQCARSADAAGQEREAYDLAGRLLDVELQQVSVPNGILKFFKPIERLVGISSAESLAQVNRDRVRDYDWAKRYRRKFKRRQTE